VRVMQWRSSRASTASYRLTLYTIPQHCRRVYAAAKEGVRMLGAIANPNPIFHQSPIVRVFLSQTLCRYRSENAISADHLHSASSVVCPPSPPPTDKTVSTDHLHSAFSSFFRWKPFKLSLGVYDGRSRRAAYRQLHLTSCHR
jgi:hypothetical protein